MGSIALVTGGAGFIGSHLVDALVERGTPVRVLDDFSTGKHENLAQAVDKIEIVQADIRDMAAVRRAMADISVVYHLAAMTSVPRSVQDPIPTHQVNTEGTLNLLVAAREAGARRFVFSSSSSVYGNTQELPQHEDLPLRPISPYGASKLLGEHYCRIFWELYGLETISLRYFNVFGPRHDPNSPYAAAIPLFISALLRGEPPTIFDDGEQSRGFTYVSDVVEANLLAAEAPAVQGQAVNISTATSVTINRVVQLARELLAVDVDPVYAPPRPGDIRHSLADVRLAEKVIGFRPKVSFQEGLRRAIAWYREHL